MMARDRYFFTLHIQRQKKEQSILLRGLDVLSEYENAEVVATIAECQPRGLTQFSVNMRVLRRAITTQGQVP